MVDPTRGLGQPSLTVSIFTPPCSGKILAISYRVPDTGKYSIDTAVPFTELRSFPVQFTSNEKN
jgi:hypothetical protein